MKFKHWGILGVLFLILGFVFILFDMNIGVYCISHMSDSCLVLTEIYNPFIWTFFALSFICIIMAIVTRSE